MAVSQDNFNKIQSNGHSLKDSLKMRENDSPVKKGNEIYATLKIPEIVQGLTAEDFKKMDRDKRVKLQKMMNQHNNEEAIRKENELFMGMTD